MPEADIDTTQILNTSETTARLPNFLIIGAMKTGTTSLFHYLEAHPQVFMSPLKEVDFFVAEANWRRGVGWYEKQFRKAGPEVLAVGEASTSYSKYPKVRGVPERIATLVPDVRIVYVVRDPVERTRSHYQHRVAIGAERDTFEDAIRTNPIYVDFSRYALQLEQYLQYFSRDQILVITSEDLRAARDSTVRAVYQFLGVDATFLPSGLDREFYGTAERANYPPAVWWVRRNLKRYFPGTKRAKEFTDATLPRYLGFGGSERRSSPLRLSASLRAEVAELFVDDVVRLRDFMPPGFGGWGIA